MASHAVPGEVDTTLLRVPVGLRGDAVDVVEAVDASVRVADAVAPDLIGGPGGFTTPADQVDVEATVGGARFAARDRRGDRRFE